MQRSILILTINPIWSLGNLPISSIVYTLACVRSMVINAIWTKLFFGIFLKPWYLPELNIQAVISKLLNWRCKTVLHCHPIINYRLNYFKIIILKVNKLIIHYGLWLDDCVKLFILLVYYLFSHFVILYLSWLPPLLSYLMLVICCKPQQKCFSL